MLGDIRNNILRSGAHLNVGDGTIESNIIEGGLELGAGYHLPSSYNIIRNNTLLGNGIDMTVGGEFNVITQNTILNAGTGIAGIDQQAYRFEENNIVENSFIQCGIGIHVISMWPSTPFGPISGNTFERDGYGILFDRPQSAPAHVFHNNFAENTVQASTVDSLDNLWDDGYPSGGNYWSNYAGSDLNSGPHQNQTGSDGIGDIPYVVDTNNQDQYPLMTPWAPPVTPANMCPADYLGNPKDIFGPGETVYVTVTPTGQRVSHYIVVDQAVWNDGDPLTDVSGGIEMLILNPPDGTQTIQIWALPLVLGNYDIVMDVNNNGVFDTGLDLVDSILIPGFNVIPEVPFGTTMIFLSMLIALVGFLGIKRFKPKFQL